MLKVARINLCSASGMANNLSNANLFPASLNYPTASNLCKNLGGNMRFPSSITELADIVKDNRSNTSCRALNLKLIGLILKNSKN